MPYGTYLVGLVGQWTNVTIYSVVIAIHVFDSYTVSPSRISRPWFSYVFRRLYSLLWNYTTSVFLQLLWMYIQRVFVPLFLRQFRVLYRSRLGPLTWIWAPFRPKCSIPHLMPLRGVSGLNSLYSLPGYILVVRYALFSPRRHLPLVPTSTIGRSVTRWRIITHSDPYVIIMIRPPVPVYFRMQFCWQRLREWLQYFAKKKDLHIYLYEQRTQVVRRDWVRKCNFSWPLGYISELGLLSRRIKS